MWNSAECLQLKGKHVFRCTYLAFTHSSEVLFPRKVVFLITFLLNGHKQSTYQCGSEVKLYGPGRSLLCTETKTEDWEGETDTKKEVEGEREQPPSIRAE